MYNDNFKVSKTNKIRECWSAYDQSVAQCHLDNYGVIYLDQYGCPIDDYYLIEMLTSEEV